MSEYETTVLGTWGLMPPQDENENVFKLSEVAQDGGELLVKAMVKLYTIGGEFGPSSYYMLYGSLDGAPDAKFITTSTLTKNINQVVDTTSGFKVPFHLKFKKAVSKAGYEYVSGSLRL